MTRIVTIAVPASDAPAGLALGWADLGPVAAGSRIEGAALRLELRGGQLLFLFAIAVGLLTLKLPAAIRLAGFVLPCALAFQ